MVPTRAQYGTVGYILRAKIIAVPAVFIKKCLCLNLKNYIRFVSKCSCRFWLFVCWGISFLCFNNDEKPSIICMKVTEHQRRINISPLFLSCSFISLFFFFYFVLKTYIHVIICTVPFSIIL